MKRPILILATLPALGGCFLPDYPKGWNEGPLIEYDQREIFRTPSCTEQIAQRDPDGTIRIVIRRIPGCGTTQGGRGRG